MITLTGMCATVRLLPHGDPTTSQQRIKPYNKDYKSYITRMMYNNVFVSISYEDTLTVKVDVP